MLVENYCLMTANDKRKLHRSLLASLVAQTDFFPFRYVWRAIYWLGAKYLQGQLMAEEGVLGIYLAGSFVFGTELHGVSDLDVLVVVDGRHRNNLALAKRLRDCYYHAIKLFPFIDTPGFCLVSQAGHHLVIEERITYIFFTEDDGTVSGDQYPYLAYRQYSGLLMPLFERDNFRLTVSQPPGLIILNGVSPQVGRIVKKMLSGKDNLYFWKTRLQYASRALEQVDAKAPLAKDKELLGWYEKMMATPNYQLYKNQNAADQARAFEIFWQLAASIVEEHERRQAQDSENGAKRLGLEGQPGTVTLIAQIPQNCHKIEAANLSYGQLKERLQQTDEEGATPLLCIFESFAVLVGGGHFSVANRFSPQIRHGDS